MDRPARGGTYDTRRANWRKKHPFTCSTQWRSCLSDWPDQSPQCICDREAPLRLLYVRPRYRGYRYAAGKVFSETAWDVDFDHALAKEIACLHGFAYVLLLRIPAGVNRSHGRFERPQGIPLTHTARACYADQRILDKWIGRPSRHFRRRTTLNGYRVNTRDAFGMTLKQLGRWGFAMGGNDYSTECSALAQISPSDSRVRKCPDQPLNVPCSTRCHCWPHDRSSRPRANSRLPNSGGALARYREESRVPGDIRHAKFFLCRRLSSGRGCNCGTGIFVRVAGEEKDRTCQPSRGGWAEYAHDRNDRKLADTLPRRAGVCRALPGRNIASSCSELAATELHSAC
jgi:hypothetical protein